MKGRTAVTGFSLIVAAVAGLAAARGDEARPAKEDITYSKDIAPLLQRKCQVCHQPGSIAPMSLLTYDDAKKYLTEIKERVQAREMPPWHIDKSVGIQQFKNDRSLSDTEIATIIRWIDAGAPAGDPADLPPPLPASNPNGWQLADSLGPPDLVIRSTPYTIAAFTQDKWYGGFAPSRSSQRARRVAKSHTTRSPISFRTSRTASWDSPKARTTITRWGQACSWNGQWARLDKSSRQTRAS
jgi:hypothetical protein